MLPFAPDTLLAFALATFATYLAPGADTAYVASVSIPRGFRAGLLAGAGVLSGVAIQAAATVLGASAVFAASPMVFEIVRWLGVAYLAYLGVRLLLARHGDADASGAMTGGPPSIILKGMTINLLNPKISLFFFAFLPQFVDPERGSVMVQLALLSAFFIAGAAPWLIFQAAVFARLGAAISASPVAALWQRRITGFVFLGFAGALAADGLRR